MMYIFKPQLIYDPSELTDAPFDLTDEKIGLFKKRIFCRFIRVKRDRQENS